MFFEHLMEATKTYILQHFHGLPKTNDYLVITNAPSMFWDHPNSTYARKSPKLDPPFPPCTQSYTFGLTPFLPLCAYVLCG